MTGAFVSTPFEVAPRGCGALVSNARLPVAAVLPAPEPRAADPAFMGTCLRCRLAQPEVGSARGAPPNSCAPSRRNFSARSSANPYALCEVIEIEPRVFCVPAGSRKRDRTTAAEFMRFPAPGAFDLARETCKAEPAVKGAAAAGRQGRDAVRADRHPAPACIPGTDPPRPDSPAAA